MGIHESLFEKIRQADRAGANALLDTWAAEHGYDHLLVEVLDPVMVRIGEEWCTNGIVTLSQAYVASKVAEDILGKIADRSMTISSGRPAKGPVVIGNVEEDFHSLGRRMVGTFLRTDGWIVHDLGNDVTAAAFVDKALEVGARVVGVSAMMMTTARNILEVRKEIDRRGLAGKIQMAVGGAIFRVCPTLAEEVGGDGTSPSAVDATELFNRLWERSQHREANA